MGSLFSGIGGLDLGLERAGMEVRWQCEIDKDARSVLAEHWPTVECHDDVKELNGTRVDVLCGGFPCQDVSVAGKRAGLAGERTGLFHEFMRIASALTPHWLLLENVPGLLSSNGGRDMGTVLGTLADLGYGWCYRVLDAQYFGVAQRRRRVFIVGCLGGATRAASVLLESESCNGDSAPSREAGPGTAARTAVSTLQGGGRRGSRIDAEGAAGGHLIAFSHTQGMDCQPSEDNFPTLRAQGGGHAVAAWDPRSVTSSANRTMVEFGRPCNTLHTAGMSIIGPAVRRLTPVECERLQGFPDDWTSCLSDSARYRTLGNAVAVPVAEFIGTQLLAQIGVTP